MNEPVNDAFVKNLFQELPPGASSKGEISFGEYIVVVNTNHIFPVERAFNSYQFIFPYSEFPVAYIDKKKHAFETKQIFSINPDQTLLAFPTQNVSYMAIFVDKNFLQEVARSMWGKTALSFKNGSSPISPAWQTLIKSFTKEYQAQQAGYEFVLQSLTTQIAVQLLRETKHNPSYEIRRAQRTSKKAINMVIDFLMEHYHSSFSLEEVASLVSYSPYHLIRLFKNETGQTPFEYLQNIKTEKAKDMLKSKNITITEVCYACGFNSPSHFSNVFKRKVGFSPTEYRKTVI
ncbi:MAG: helix-turn-helix domain-containing protein [bacterium]|jgi:AraC family transcriptional regulator